MKVAVVGPRQGADTDAVAQFCTELYREDPEIVLISGGARGVDAMAEGTWYALGGLVWSYRIHQDSPDNWVAHKWVYSKSNHMNALFRLQGHPSFLDPTSALFYRSTLAAEEADQVVAFEGKLSMRGTEFTLTYARDIGRPVHLYRDGAWVE